MDNAALGVLVILPGILAALSHNKRLKYFCLAVSCLIAVASPFGVLR
jgi:hypothetical protein